MTSLSETISRLRADLEKYACDLTVDADDLGALLDAAERASTVTDHIDMMIDELQRIKACPGADDEIKQLCERAVKVVYQHVPVIVQRDLAEADCRRLMTEITDLKAEIVVLEEDRAERTACTVKLAADWRDSLYERDGALNKLKQAEAQLAEMKAHALAGTDSADLLTMLSERTLEVAMLKAKLAASERAVVKLPQRYYQYLDVGLEPRDDGDWLNRDEVIEALEKAGVKHE